MDATKIKPNDIAIILRPDAEEGKAFEGTFEILIAGYGPFNMSEDEVRSLVSIAMMMASTISLMEEDVKLTERIMERCAQIYVEPEEVMKEDIDNTFTLLSSTKCVGGMQ